MTATRSTLLGSLAVLAPATTMCVAANAQQTQKPNILVIMADDIGYWNISAYNRGMMGYHTPSIDRIAHSGAFAPISIRRRETNSPALRASPTVSRNPDTQYQNSIDFHFRLGGHRNFSRNKPSSASSVTRINKSPAIPVGSLSWVDADTGARRRSADRIYFPDRNTWLTFLISPAAREIHRGANPAFCDEVRMEWMVRSRGWPLQPQGNILPRVFFDANQLASRFIVRPSQVAGHSG
jgi:hypothetical protein